MPMPKFKEIFAMWFINKIEEEISLWERGDGKGRVLELEI